jgi:ribose transport system ATP-binding protein
MPGTPLSEQPRLRLEHIGKTFGRYRALDDVSFTIAKGELHGLVGQNGSGKSTLAKVLTGYHAPDAGSVVTVDSEVLRLPVRPEDLTHYGVAVVHQSFGLLDDLTVIENLRLSRFGHRRFTRRIDWGVERAAVTDVLERLDCDVDPNALVGSLSVELKATLAIARAIQSYEPGRGLIIFDESTRALNRDGLARFYTLIRGVLDSGASVLLICHRLEEVLEHTDRVTVLRDGKVAAGGLPTASLTEAELTRTMLGYALTRHVSTRGRSSSDAPGAATVTVSGLSGDIVQDLDLSVQSGEVVGLTGLDGSGHSEVPYLLSGAHPVSDGTMTLDGRTFDLASTSGGALTFLHAGVAMVPSDRDKHGLLMDESIKVNITLPRVREKSHPLRVEKGWERREVDGMVGRLGISPPEPEMLVSRLSGGNQQKVLLAKWLAGQPSLLLLDEPTQAVDVGARKDILQALEQTAARGCAVVIASTYADELAIVCDRVLVFHDGIVVAELSGELTEDEIIEATFRTHKQQSLAGA